MEQVQWFTERHTPIQRRPILGLQAKGSASLNAAAFTALGEPDHIRLGYLPQRRAIVLSATTDGDPIGYPLRRVGDSSSTRLFSLKAFSVAHSLPLGRSRRYVGEISDGMLVFDLENEFSEKDEAGDGQQRLAV